jgi:DNA-binding NarL/FixJ family response regulator
MGVDNGTGVIRVVLAATSSVRRAGLEAIIKGHPSLWLVGTVSALPSLSPHVREHQPDVIVADLDHADNQVLATISSAGGRVVPVIVLVEAASTAWVAHALRSGISAILPRESGGEEIVAAIRAVDAGLVLLDPEVSQDLARHVTAREDQPEPAALGELTAREMEVLRMLGDGMANKEMAARLGISEHTIKFHVSSILDKLGAASRTEAVTMGIRMGMIAI